MVSLVNLTLFCVLSIVFIHLHLREGGALIIHSPVLMRSGGEVFRDEDWDPHAYGSMENLFVEGTWNSEFADEVKPSESDIILRNRVNFSAFRGTILKDVIETHGITRLFVMGFLTNVCVEETTVEARELFPDLKIYVCSDGCAAKTKQVNGHTIYEYYTITAIPWSAIWETIYCMQ